MTEFLRQPLFAIAVMFLAGCQTFDSASFKEDSISRQTGVFVKGNEGGDHRILKAKGDRRSFRNIRLSNGLPVSLISDSESDFAAAALRVEVGSVQDPEDFQGLAHFLEHMLFLGSTNYPEPGQFSQFTKDNGGDDNAFTTLDSTTYFFRVDPAALREALDRFRDFFTSPLLLKDYVRREVNAVDAEYWSRAESEGSRLFEVFKATFPEGHYLRKLSVGNRLTLLGDAADGQLADTKTHSSEKVDALRAALVLFFEEYYGASNMRLAVSGPQSLDQLELLAQGFSSIPQSANADHPFDRLLWQPQPVIEDRTLLLVETEQAMNLLSLRFAIPQPSPFLLHKSIEYVGNILGHEGENSLLARYKRENLASGITVGSSLHNQGGALITADISLSDKGMREPSKVIAMFYDAVQVSRNELLDTTTVGAAKQRYREQAQLAHLHARFGEVPSSSASTLHAVAAPGFYPEELAIVGSSWFAGLDVDQVLQLLGAIRPANSQVLIASEDFTHYFKDGNAALRQRTHWYPVNYFRGSVTDLPDAAGYCWSSHSDCSNNAAPLSSADILPPSNPYIPAKFAIRNPKKLSDSGSEAWRPSPQLAASGSWGRLWLLEDDAFAKPKADIKLLFRGANKQTPRDRVLGRLYVGMIADALQANAYDAYLAGLNYRVKVDERGFHVQVQGFDDGLEQLLKDVLLATQISSIDEEVFDRVRTKVESYFSRQRNADPLSRTSQALSAYLNENHFLVEEYEAVLATASAKDVLDYVRTLWPAVTVDGLLHGNLDRTSVGRVRAIICESVGCSPASRTVTAPADWSLQSGDSDFDIGVEQQDVAVQWYMQAPDDSLESQIKLTLLDQIVAQSFFRELRTEQQLGYRVSAYSRIDNHLAALLLSVQSSRFSTAEISQSIDTWVAEQLRFADGAALNKTSFEQQRQAMVLRFMQPDKSIYERTELLWRSILRDEYDFDRQRKAVALLKSLTLEEMQSFTKKLLSPENRRLLILRADPALASSR